MFGLGKHGPDGQYGLVVDVGSATVTAAIVASNPLSSQPEIIWTHKERCSIGDTPEATSLHKLITSAIVQLFLQVGSTGIKALVEHESGAKLASCTVTVSAPWSYTVTKTVSSSADEDFMITNGLLTNLEETAEKKALAIIDENELSAKLGLAVIANDRIDIQVNGYQTSQPAGQKAKKISISQVTGVAQSSLIEAITESHEKIVPNTKLRLVTFSKQFYDALQQLEPDTSEICLVDIGGEATEIGIVRDSILRFVTHIPYGMYSLVREIAAITAAPKEEIFAALQNDWEGYVAGLTNKKATEVTAVIDSYQDCVADLFSRTGDTLSIPKPLFLHTDSGFESFGRTCTKQAAQTATSLDHTVHNITERFFNEIDSVETRICLSAFVFHNKHQRSLK